MEIIIHYFTPVFLISGSVVDALILEAPYTSMAKAVTVHPLASVRSQYIDFSPFGIFNFTIQEHKDMVI